MRSKTLQKMIDKITPEDHARMEREMYEHLAHERWLEEQGHEYGTKTSYSLKVLNEAGFFPIGITYMSGEETFIFKDSEKANEAWESHLLGWDGWWYGEREFKEVRKEYEDEWQVKLNVTWF